MRPPADHGDLDHCVEWKPDGGGGPTAQTNLAALHRGHHNLKTSRFWDSDQSIDGTLRWTMATGRTVTTYPHVYDHPDNTPIDVSNLEARIGRRLAGVLNPDIPLPGHINILDRIGWAQDLAPVTPAPPKHPWPEGHSGQKQPTKAKAKAHAQEEWAAVWQTQQDGPPPF